MGIKLDILVYERKLDILVYGSGGGTAPEPEFSPDPESSRERGGEGERA